MSSLVKTKKQSTWKEKFKRAAGGVAKGANVVALSTQEYFVGVKDAYDIGYKSGFEDAYRIPKKIGSQVSAVSGYKTGLGAHMKAQKAFAKYHKRKLKVNKRRSMKKR
ncbi:MAG: hypothetical protein E7612_08105 [Ruminococcaceae bacterium]|nr:hypothetical protein [Oscillospiraceae bacterium]